MQGFEPFAPVVGAARRFAVDGNELVPVRPQRGDPAVETAAEQDRVDPIDQGAHPTLAGDAMMEFRKAPQKVEMVLAPGGDVVEVITGGDGGADHQKQNLPERIHHPPRLTVIAKFGKVLQQQGQSRPRGLLVEDRVGTDVHARAPCRIRAPKESRSASQDKITRKCPLT